MGSRNLFMKPEILAARYTHQEIIRKCNWIAPIYDFFGILMESKARQRALEIARIQNEEKIFEVALGTGLNFLGNTEKESGWMGGWNRCLPEDGGEGKKKNLQNGATKL
jgi:hypothetical protein